MTSRYGDEKILVGESIYSRPQTRVTRAYNLWQQNNPTASALEFLRDNCKEIGHDSKYISKWRCDDNDGAYIVKAVIWKDGEEGSI